MGLHLREVARSYGKGENVFQALKPTTFGINPGTTVAIVGKSGSGKSTLLHLLVGLDHPTSGEVLFNGKNILKDYRTDSWRGENVGIVFQQFFLQPKDTVLENVALPLKIKGVSKKIRTKEATRALELVGLADKAKNKANDLSGGQKQRVAIARAIVTKPAVLVADEPTGNLDSENGDAVEKLLFDLNKQLGTTLVLVTHDEDLAARCQRIIRLRDGMVIQDTAAKSRPVASGAAAPQPTKQPRPVQSAGMTVPQSMRPSNQNLQPVPAAKPGSSLQVMSPMGKSMSRMRQLVNGKPKGVPVGTPVIGGKTMPKPIAQPARPIGIKRPFSKPIAVHKPVPIQTPEAKTPVHPSTPAAAEQATASAHTPVNHSARRKIL